MRRLFLPQKIKQVENGIVRGAMEDQALMAEGLDSFDGLSITEGEEGGEGTDKGGTREDD